MFDSWKYKEYPELTHIGHPDNFSNHMDEWWKIYTHNMGVIFRRLVLMAVFSFTASMAILMAFLHWGIPILQNLWF